MGDGVDDADDDDDDGGDDEYADDDYHKDSVRAVITCQEDEC